jgi:serine protease Do
MNRRTTIAAMLALGSMCGVGPTLAASLADTIAQTKGSVVAVGTFRATDSPRFQLRGTGFVVGDGRLVVTNAHVLPEDPGGANASALVVLVRKSSDGTLENRAATLVGTDAPRDLALLRIEGAPVPALQVGDSSRVREGDALAFSGFPIGGLLGYSSVTHRAMVSSITAALVPSPSADRLREQAIRGLRLGMFDIFQLDATAYPGNSGGPLFDPGTGEVLGVMNMVLIKSARESALSHPSGISYAIPSRYVLELLARHR